MSWLLDEQQHELESYDFIGICYYYKGDIQNAHHYHNKMMQGKAETEES